MSQKFFTKLFLLLLLSLPAFGQVGWFGKRFGGTVNPGGGGDVFNWITQDPIVIVDGNSISAGYGLNPGELRYDQLLAQDSPFDDTGITYYNFAVSGQTTQQMASDAATQIDTYVASGRKVILIAWEMTNDLYFGASVSATQSNFRAYCLARKAAGVYRVVVITMIPRNSIKLDGSNSTIYNADIDACNTWLRSNYTEFADALVDVRTIPEFATPAAMASGGLAPDGIHPNQAGLVKIKNALRPVLLGLAP